MSLSEEAVKKTKNIPITIDVHQRNGAWCGQQCSWIVQTGAGVRCILTNRGLTESVYTEHVARWRCEWCIKTFG